MQNKKPEQYALEYAGLWIRLAAAIIDFIVLVSGLYILYCVISQSLFWIFPSIQEFIRSLIAIANGAHMSIFNIWLIATILLVFMVGSTVYFVLCWATTGQTLGKMGTGIKVIRTDSSALDLRVAFIRYLGSIITVATLGVGFFILVFDQHKQSLHDRIADTYVVKLPVRQVTYDRTLARGGVG